MADVLYSFRRIALFVLGVIFCTHNVNAQNTIVGSNDSLIAKAKRLQQYYNYSKEVSSGELFRKLFFEEFPNSFQELNAIYGYNNDTAALLYYNSMDHINTLFDVNNINDTIFYKKIINISIGGHWDADAVEIFQDGLRKRVLLKPELVTYILEVYSKENIRKFWYFYFDGVFPPKKMPEELKSIKHINPEIDKLMIQAFHEIKPKNK